MNDVVVKADIRRVIETSVGHWVERYVPRDLVREFERALTDDIFDWYRTRHP